MPFNRDTLVQGVNAQATRLAASAARWSAEAARVGIKRGLSAIAALPRATMELVFPGACLSCRAEIDASEPRATDLPLCDTCFESLDLLHEPMCQRVSIAVVARAIG